MRREFNDNENRRLKLFFFSSSLTLNAPKESKSTKTVLTQAKFLFNCLNV